MARVVVVLSLLAALSYGGSEPLQRQERLTLDELKQFAEKSSGLGGELRSFEYEGRKIAVVMRSFTSGVESSDFGVYAATKDGRYHRVLYREMVWGSFFRPAQDRDVIIVLLQPMSSHTEQVAFTFTISGCYDPQDK
jgi:hypothetical protein